jgi:hypothetical protein
MPKGVYNRSKPIVQEVIQQEPVTNPISHEVGINKVRVSQMPDRQSANANVEVIRQSHGDESISTTERLFGSLEQQAEDNNQDPNISQEPLISQPVAQNPEELEQPRFKESNSPVPMESKPLEDDFIDWEKMANKKIRQKVDGKEVVTTVEELRKYSDQDQIKKHLADAADRVGQERRKLAEERQQWNQLRNQAPQGTPTEVRVPQEQNVNLQNLQNDPVFQRIQFLEQQVQQLAQGIQPSIYESNRQRVANELKALGFTDFNDYLPKMESVVIGLKDPNLVNFYDTPEGSKALYFQLKAHDLQKAPPKQQIIPRGTSNPTPPAAQIDGGSQSSGSFNDDSGHNYRSAFKRATSLGDDREAWNEVLRQKGILPD